MAQNVEAAASRARSGEGNVRKRNSSLFYQAAGQSSIGTDIDCEALAAMESTRAGGTVSPIEHHAVAEDMGLIVDSALDLRKGVHGMHAMAGSRSARVNFVRKKQFQSADVLERGKVRARGFRTCRQSSRNSRSPNRRCAQHADEQTMLLPNCASLGCDYRWTTSAPVIQASSYLHNFPLDRK